MQKFLAPWPKHLASAVIILASFDQKVKESNYRKVREKYKENIAICTKKRGSKMNEK